MKKEKNIFESNRRKNSWWLKIFKDKIRKYLEKHKIPRQTIGIFLNPITSNKERRKIYKNFVIKKIHLKGK